MRTKYTITIDGTELDVPYECLRNWQDISFSVKRTDYSGIMRSFSTEFEFCGEIADLLYGEYLTNGFTSSAMVAVYTITNRHTWEKQFEAPLDFSTLELEEGVLSINAIDNSIGAMLKAKKSTKYEFSMNELHVVNALMRHMNMKSNAVFTLAGIQKSEDRASIDANITLDNVITTDYFEVTDEYDGNEFFAMCNQNGFPLSVDFDFEVECPLSASYYDDSVQPWHPVESMKFWIKVDDGVSEPAFRGWSRMIADNQIRSRQVPQGDLELVAQSVAELLSWRQNPDAGDFGIVGAYSNSMSDDFWDLNTVYEWDGTQYVAKGAPRNYVQRKKIKETVEVPRGELGKGYHVGLFMECAKTTYEWQMNGTFKVYWDDMNLVDFYVSAFTPQNLLSALIGKICPDATARIDSTGDDLFNSTYLIPGENLRSIGQPKAYTTFNDFATWMESVFGYTYYIDGNVVVFAPRESVFKDIETKVFTRVNDVQLSINDKLIYSRVIAGAEVVEYDSVNGRDQWFMNEYDTGIATTDNQLQLTCKYRSDCYGIEYTMRKAHKETTDDKADEKMFFMHLGHETPDGPLTVTTTVEVEGVLVDDVYGAEYTALQCIAANSKFIASMGVPLTLEHASTSGNGTLIVDGNAIGSDVTISERLFTAAELSFKTDDMKLPDDLHGYVTLEHGGYRYSGYISEAEANFGMQQGVEYKLIVKDIEAL